MYILLFSIAFRILRKGFILLIKYFRQCISSRQENTCIGFLLFGLLFLQTLLLARAALIRVTARARFHTICRFIESHNLFDLQTRRRG